jgi:Flp pilus assembly protein TadB
MSTTYIFIAVVMIMVIMGVILGLVFVARGKRSERFHDQFGTEYDRTVKTLGNGQSANRAG